MTPPGGAGIRGHPGPSLLKPRGAAFFLGRLAGPAVCGRRLRPAAGAIAGFRQARGPARARGSKLETVICGRDEVGLGGACQRSFAVRETPGSESICIDQESGSLVGPRNRRSSTQPDAPTAPGTSQKSHLMILPCVTTQERSRCPSAQSSRGFVAHCGARPRPKAGRTCKWRRYLGT